MNKSELKELRQRIESDIAAVNASLAPEQHPEVAVELDQTRVGRLSRMDAMQQQAMSSGIRERLRLKKRRLEAALERVDMGRFGLCCACGNDVPPARLRADPGTPFCADCQSEIDEHR